MSISHLCTVLQSPTRVKIGPPIFLGGKFFKERAHLLEILFTTPVLDFSSFFLHQPFLVHTGAELQAIVRSSVIFLPKQLYFTVSEQCPGPGPLEKGSLVYLQMKEALKVFGVVLAANTAPSAGFESQLFTRRNLFKSASAAAVAVRTSVLPAASVEESVVSCYFGVGCFWHVQHEFVEAEKKILGRGERELTSLAGYAGGTQLGKDRNRPDLKRGLVCYQNPLGIADYGKLGHAEVVGMLLPADKITSFTAEYFTLFEKNGDRPDKGDRGPEYRSLMGIPGGMESPYIDGITTLARSKGLQLQAGVGDDSDTLGNQRGVDRKCFLYQLKFIIGTTMDSFPGKITQIHITFCGQICASRDSEDNRCPDIKE